MTATTATEKRAELVERWIVREAYSRLLILLFVGGDAVMHDPMPEADGFTEGFEAGSEAALGDLTRPMAEALWPYDVDLEECSEFQMANLRAQLLTARMFAALACVGSSQLANLAAYETATAEQTATRLAACTNGGSRV